MQPKTLEEVKKISPKTLLKLIERAKKYLKTNDVFVDMCKDHNVDVDVIDLIPVRFGDLEVSGRTDHGIIILNYKLLCDGDFFKDYQYLLHECSHIFQQCYGDAATKSADDGDYLHNPFEQEGFQRQLEYVDDQFGKEEAEGYVEHLLDHHDKDGKEKEKLKEVLLERVK
jgi:hypothetical protein